MTTLHLFINQFSTCSGLKRQFPRKSKSYNVTLLKVLTLTGSVRKNSDACSKRGVREPSVQVANMCQNYRLKKFDKFLTYYIFTCNISFTTNCPSFCLVSAEVGSEFWHYGCNTLYVQKLSGHYISLSLNYACMTSRIILYVTCARYPTCSCKKTPSHCSTVFIATCDGENSEVYT